MKFRVLQHESNYYLQSSKLGLFWETQRIYGDKDEALLAFTRYLDHARERREARRKTVIAQEKV